MRILSSEYENKYKCSNSDDWIFFSLNPGNGYAECTQIGGIGGDL